MGADFLAIHTDGEILKVQLKSRITISKKYQGKVLYMAFPVGDRWCLIAHDELVDMVPWLGSASWVQDGHYSAATVSKKLSLALEPYLL